MPKHFCTNCITNLNAAYQFREQCELTQEKLIRHLTVPDSDETLNNIPLILSQGCENISNDHDEKKIGVEWAIECLGNQAVAKAFDPIPVPLTNSPEELQINMIESKIQLKIESTADEVEESVEYNMEMLEIQKEEILESNHVDVVHNKPFYYDQPENSADRSDNNGEVIENNVGLKIGNTDVEPKKLFSCDRCTAALSTLDSLKRHKWRHDGGKPFKCDKCAASFICPYNLTIHLRKHTNAKRIKCEHCSSHRFP